METDYSVYTEGILKDLKELIRSDVNAGMDRNPGEYMDRALENMKRSYQMANKMSRYQAWSIRNRKDLMDIWAAIQSDILTGVEKYMKDCKHKKLTKEIRMATARAAIKAAMQEAGLKHQFTGQTYRARVSVLITQNRAITIYISYKKMHEQLPRIIESLKLICQEIDCLGKDVIINKAYNIGEFI